MIYTKAPWFAVEFGGFWEIMDGEYYESNKLLDEDSCPDAEANAKLAATAPELLKALIEIDKELAGRFHRDYDKSLDLMSNDLKEIVTKIREVIKKATE